MNKTWLGCALLVAAAGCGADRPVMGEELEPVDTADGSSGTLDAALPPHEDDLEDAALEDAGSAPDASGASDSLDASGPDANSHVDGSAVEDASGSDAGDLLDASIADAAGDVADANSAQDASLPDANVPDGEVTLEQFCAGQGPVIKIPGGAAGAPVDVCTGTVARQRFKNALCTCDDANIKGYLNTGSFDSSEDELETFTKAGGSVGINGNMGIIAAGYADVGGSFRIYDGATFAGYVHVYGDLEFNGSTTVGGYIDVARDAKFREDMFIFGHANIGRDVYTRPWKWEPPLWSFIGGKRISKEFTLEEPCACKPSELLDVDAIVRAGKLKNDNDHPQVQLSPTALANLSFNRTVELPCGRFFLTEITGVGNARIKINGRTALFVEGNVAQVGRLDIELGPQAELDLFISGNLAQVGYGTFGDVNRPSAVRVYVGGDGDIFYRGYQPFGANLYAPKSRLHSDGFIDAKGSIFVRTLDVNGYLKVNYDRDVLDQGDDDACTPPPPTSTPDAGVPDASVPDASAPDAAAPDASAPDASAPDASTPPPPPPQCSNSCDELCGSKACKDGMCGACASDADCCAPLVCYSTGVCGPLLL